MPAYAIYRLPHEDHATLIRQTDGEPLQLSSLTELNGQCGFVLAPFAVSDSSPVLVIRPDIVDIVECGSPTLSCVPSVASRCPINSQLLPPSSKFTYSIDFANYHSQLEAGYFTKIVLARCTDKRMVDKTEPIELFNKACEMYPRLFIALVETEKSGCWLTATPEILLDGNGHNWRTIALAGTMKLEGDQLNGEGENLTWSTKNIQEQRIVATYITECLEQFTDNYVEEGPRTVRAANLVHLRSDFTFSLKDNDHIGNLLQALHPTPAVCGLPKLETFRFIMNNEHTPRRYYSGFIGPMGTEETHLYVSLRCMNIDGDVCHLYAGGGLLKDSILEQEWNETEAKLQTMLQLLRD